MNCTGNETFNKERVRSGWYPLFKKCVSQKQRVELKNEEHVHSDGYMKPAARPDATPEMNMLQETS